jgi:hypothetical protein
LRRMLTITGIDVETVVVFPAGSILINDGENPDTIADDIVAELTGDDFISTFETEAENNGVNQTTIDGSIALITGNTVELEIISGGFPTAMPTLAPDDKKDETGTIIGAVVGSIVALGAISAYIYYKRNAQDPLKAKLSRTGGATNDFESGFVTGAEFENPMVAHQEKRRVSSQLPDHLSKGLQQQQVRQVSASYINPLQETEDASLQDSGNRASARMPRLSASEIRVQKSEERKERKSKIKEIQQQQEEEEVGFEDDADSASSEGSNGSGDDEAKAMKKEKKRAKKEARRAEKEAAKSAKKEARRQAKLLERAGAPPPPGPPSAGGDGTRHSSAGIF